MNEIYASDQYLLHIAFERANGAGEDDRAGIAELISAISALTAPWLGPLGIGFQFAHCDTARYFEQVGEPVQPHHFLRRRMVPDGVRVGEAFADSIVTDVQEIDESAVRDAVMRGLGQPSPPGVATTLTELRWTAVRARSPIIDPIELAVAGRPVSTVSEIIDGQRWYFGPASGLAGPPAQIRAVNDHTATTIELEVFWDLWIEIPEGRALVDAGIVDVLARPGWERSS